MISVIFPTRNRADLLAAALASLAKQMLAQSDFEVLVIDNGSTDHTAQVLSDYEGMLPNMRAIHAPEPGLHTGRHVGMQAAKGEVLVFADDDIEALPTWLAAIKEAFLNPEVAMVGGNNFPLFLEPPPSWLLKMWEKPDWQGLKAIPALSIIEFPRNQGPLSPYLIWGCNFAIRKDVLLAAGGFHPDGMPKELIRFRGDGETHVSRHVAESGLKCVFHSGASVYHKVTPERMTFAYLHQRGFNQGVSDSYTELRNQNRPASTVRRSLVRRATSWGLRNLRNVMSDRDVKHALEHMKLGHREGYVYHQKAYRDDPALRAWVHRQTYF
jgi:glycosyltransferase involved in cell wall biosynthesis